MSTPQPPDDLAAAIEHETADCLARCAALLTRLERRLGPQREDPQATLLDARTPEQVLDLLDSERPPLPPHPHQPLPTPALARWWREIQDGLRTADRPLDALWKAAAYEAAAREAETQGLWETGRHYRDRARDVGTPHP